MTIIREPATGIPKIPGTSLAGAIRSYAEMAREEDSGLPEIRVVFGEVSGNEGLQGPVLLVDDMVDSKWTFTVASALLRQAGSGPVYPFALADSSSENGE